MKKLVYMQMQLELNSTQLNSFHFNEKRKRMMRCDAARLIVMREINADERKGRLFHHRHEMKSSKP